MTNKMNLYLASSFDEKRGFGAYCVLYEGDGQQMIHRWQPTGRCTPDSLALECATDAFEQVTHIVPLAIYSQNATLLRGATDYLPERRYRMANQLPVNHAHLWLLLDRHIDEWVSQQVTLEWKQGSHPLVVNELKRLMLR